MRALSLGQSAASSSLHFGYFISVPPGLQKGSQNPSKILLNIIIIYHSFRISEPKWSRLTGPENIGPERTLSGLLVRRPVNSPSRITLENNGKFRPQPDRENGFAGASGGGNGTAVEPSLLSFDDRSMSGKSLARPHHRLQNDPDMPDRKDLAAA